MRNASGGRTGPVSIAPFQGTATNSAAVLALARERMIAVAHANPSQHHGAFHVVLEGTTYFFIWRQQPSGGYTLIYTGGGCDLGMDTGLLVYTGAMLDGVDAFGFIDFPGSPATPVAPATVHYAKVKPNDLATDSHPWGEVYHLSGVIKNEILTPPGGALFPSCSFQYKDATDVTESVPKNVLFEKKLGSQIFPSSLATSKYMRLFVQSRWGRRVADFLKNRSSLPASCRWYKGLNLSNTTPIPEPFFGQGGGFFYFYPSNTFGDAIHIDSKWNFNVIQIGHLGERGVDPFEKNPHGVFVTQLRFDPCVASLRVWLRDPEGGGAATLEQRTRVISWMFAYSSVPTNDAFPFSQVPATTRHKVRIHTTGDPFAGGLYENPDGDPVLDTSAALSNGENTSLPVMKTMGYGYKFSKTGQRCARVSAHLAGSLADPGGGLIKRQNGDFTISEHEFTFERDPDTDESGGVTEADKEALHWTVTETLINQVEYNNYTDDPMVVTYFTAMPSGVTVFSSSAPAPKTNYFERTLQYAINSFAHSTTPSIGNPLGEDPVASFPAPSGVIPWYVIGYDDDDAYYRIDVDVDNNKWMMAKVTNGASAPFSGGPLDATGVSGIPVTGWFPVIPLDNQECVYWAKRTPGGDPAEAWRFTPRGGFEMLMLSTARYAAFSGFYNFYDRESAISGVYVSGSSNIIVYQTVDLTGDYGGSDKTLRPWQYIFVGHE